MCCYLDVVRELGSTKPKKSPNWVSNIPDQLREKRNQAKLIFHDKPTQVNRQKCKDLNKQLNKAYEEDERKHLEDKLHELKHAAEKNQYNVVWRVVK